MKRGFTVLEMIIVLSVIALLFILTLPNIKQKQDIIDNKGCDALIEVVNSQILLYKLDQEKDVNSVNDLIQEGYLKEKQSKCGNGKRISIKDGQASAK